MPRHHAHIESALTAALLSLCLYGGFWLFSFSPPAMVFGLPTWLALFIVLYIPAYLVFRARWRK